jgi:hypothetical protein
LPEEVRAVVEDSPKLQCCEKFRDADLVAFVKHLKERIASSAWRASGEWIRELRTIAANAAEQFFVRGMQGRGVFEDDC